MDPDSRAGRRTDRCINNKALEPHPLQSDGYRCDWQDLDVPVMVSLQPLMLFASRCSAVCLSRDVRCCSTMCSACSLAVTHLVLLSGHRHAIAPAHEQHLHINRSICIKCVVLYVQENVLNVHV